MSGGPPHHPHSRQAPPANAAWNHLQVPNYFPTRQPQHAHMSNEHSLLHQPTWHTPTTEPMKTIPHSHIFSLEQMLSERQFPRHAPGVDLSLTRNGSQNGEILTSPISLSVRDTNKINSLPASALDIQPVEVGPAAIKPVSPGMKSISPGLSGDAKSKRSSKRVDSILERLNPNLEKQTEKTTETAEKDGNEEKPTANRSVIVQAASSHDENSNSSSILNVPTPTNVRDDEVVSPYSNEDSLDSNKSRRKRKPSKTMRVPKEEEKAALPDSNQSTNPEPEVKKDSKTNEEVSEEKKIPERRRSSDDAVEEVPAKTRRKTSSESETIDNIAAMVQESLKSKPEATPEEDKVDSKCISVSVIKTKDNLQDTLTSETSDLSNSSNNVTTTAQKKATNTQFVEVENKLEEMFAGIEDTSDPLKTDSEATKLEDLSKLEDNPASTSQDNVTSTSNDLTVVKKSPKKGKRKQRNAASRRNSDANSAESTPKKKMGKKASKAASKSAKTKKNSKIESVKDVYAYDSGSNASSSKSRGPFIQIRGPRDSPLSVSVINTPTNDDDPDKKPHKTKKFHDDSEYRHKVRSKGLHCSTLSNQYDAQRKDTSWICAFCKRGPHATETTGPTLNSDAPAPGDLFGPYFITTNSPEFERRLDDPYDKQFKSKKIARTLDSNAVNAKVTGKKFKRKLSLDLKPEDDIYVGITDTGSGTFEIWAHEDCIVWSAGIYLVGPKIVGLEEAVWTSCNVLCEKCHLKGANICCLKRGCVSVAHVCCARLTSWQFHEDSYKTFCPEHRVL
ncbi:GPI-anchored adhesin-like protein PGA55 [Asbolus verrucosus]|uniref:GPI-anchored adhesin-like protein PGA55 n=1 Tax=Asbolus verrucosus TaxID=1661398 RepID=A0A482VE83_ASBVE|nr:GPI-anchored adhesin-like protein PGA55 [Asbolus verrucosus]